MSDTSTADTGAAAISTAAPAGVAADTGAAAAATTTGAAPAVAGDVAPVLAEGAAGYVPPADWRGTVTDPEEKEFATRLANPADAVKVALDFRKKNSAMIRVPGKDASPEDRLKFNKAIGVPETVEGYKFDIGREPTDADKAIQGNLAKIAFDNGIPATAMTALSKAVSELAGAQMAEQNRVAVAAREANEAALRKEWGADYEANKTLATRAVQAFGEVKSHPEVIDFFDKTMVNGQKLGDHPVMIRMLGNIGRRMGEGEFIGAVGSDQRTSLQSELQTIMSENPPGTEKYKLPAVQARIKAINEQLYGNEPAMRLG